MRRLILAALLSVATGGMLAEAQPAIRQRQRAQQMRIGQGVATGELTPRETRRLEAKERALARSVRRDRVDGGRLTAHERRKIDRRQDRLSRQIYREKHDPQRVR